MLSRGPSQRVALQDGLRSGKEQGGDVLVCMEKYHNIIEMTEENMTEDERKLMQEATGDDGDILVKIVEVAFVPVLAKKMSDDERFHGEKEIGDKLAMGFTYFTLVVHIFAKTNILDVADDMFYIYDNRQELFITQEAQPIIRDSKGDVVINACNRNFHQTGKYQLEDMDWRTMKPVVEDYIEDHIKYETIHGRHKIETRNRAVVMIATEQNQLGFFCQKAGDRG